MNDRPTQPQVACALASGLVMAVLSALATLYVSSLLLAKPGERMSSSGVTLITLGAGVLMPLFAAGFLHLLPPMSCPNCTQPLPHKRLNWRHLNLMQWLKCPRCGCTVDALGRDSSR